MNDTPTKQEATLAENKNSRPEPESVRIAMEQAWQDHHHTRDQTWKTLQIALTIAAGLVAIDWKIDNVYSRIFSGALIAIIAYSGIKITLRHRNSVEIRKFRHILNCEEFLGLHRPDLIDGVSKPQEVSFFWDVFKIWLPGNTSLFILRMHTAILLFGLVFFIWGLNSLL